MPLVSLGPVLAEARDGRYAVPAFNPVDYATMKAMVVAAEEANSPVIIQTSAKTVRYYSHEALVGWMREIAHESPIPVVLHLDHGKDLDMIRQCIETGWTSVMIDASDLPFEKNLERSRQVVEWAIAAGVGVEAEIGEIGGVEEDLVVDPDSVKFTDPDEAERFCSELQLSAFAGQIGTLHGYYKGEPDVQFGLIEEINRRTGVPMALHGGTGLSDETFRRCIELGCSKINISTNLKHVFVDSFVQHNKDNPADYEPLSVLRAQFDACKDLFIGFMKKFGSAGRGREMLEKVA